MIETSTLSMAARPETEKKNYFAVADGVWGIKDKIVNMYIVENPDGSWVLIDTGLGSSGQKIKDFVDRLIDPGSKPTCIILTHGHFDHVGSVAELAREWDVPVYAHDLEFPYLNGTSAYPPPDPSVGGGLMASLSWMYPKDPIDISERLRMLPEDCSVPGLPGWTYLHTPGHSPGHVSFFRKSDKVLIAGDAFVTTKQESAISVLLQLERVSGPPKYFTPDWEFAEESVQALAALEPEIVATGHGSPMSGEHMRAELEDLAEFFDVLAVPRQGRYVDDPAIADENGVQYIPPKITNPTPSLIAGAALIAVAGVLLAMRR